MRKSLQRHQRIRITQLRVDKGRVKLLLLVAVIGDLDFLMMYAPSMDGIDRIEALGTGSFSVDDWFQPYSLLGAITNPFMWPEELAYPYETWENF